MSGTQNELPELLAWLRETIEPLEGQQWQITLNSSGYVVQATAKIVQSKRRDDRRGISTTITKVTEAKFRLGQGPLQRTVFRTD